MTEAPKLVFEDGESYERMMGIWSRKIGDVFVDWLAPSPFLRWLDVGCGNGVSSQFLLERARAGHVSGIDPSEAQIAFARKRLEGRAAEFQTGSATALPFTDDSFDAVTMALVLFFVPEPERAVSEMVRVVRPGGTVSAYVWDVPAGGLPFIAIQRELESRSISIPMPPRPDASTAEALERLWHAAGLEGIETRAITVERRYPDFDDYWTTHSKGPLTQLMASLTPEHLADIKAGVRKRLQIGPGGEVVCTGTANAVRGMHKT